MSTFRSLLIAMVVVVVFVAGCGSGDGGDDTAAAGTGQDVETDEANANDSSVDAGAADGEEPDTAAPNTDAGSDGGKDTGPADDAYLESDSPLAAYMGFDFSDSDAMVEAQRQIDEKVQTCMRGQGFEYELSTMTGSQTFEDRGSMSDADFAAEHGYGLADSMLEFAARMTGDVDPNIAMVQSMSDTERAAWETAMYGQPLEEAESQSVGPPGGCFGAAQTEVFGDFAVFQQLQPALESMQEEIEADPRVVAISEGWATCMGDAGYNFATTSDARDAVSEKIDAFLTSTDPTALEPTEEEIQELETIKVEEIAIASADVACIGDNLEEMKEINREYELRFIEENQAILDGGNS